MNQAIPTKDLASKGRNGDTLIAHINPREAYLLKLFGGSGTINPDTGLLEFYEGEDDGSSNTDTGGFGIDSGSEGSDSGGFGDFGGGVDSYGEFEGIGADLSGYGAGTNNSASTYGATDLSSILSDMNTNAAYNSEIEANRSWGDKFMSNIMDYDYLGVAKQLTAGFIGAATGMVGSALGGVIAGVPAAIAGKYAANKAMGALSSNTPDTGFYPDTTAQQTESSSQYGIPSPGIGNNESTGFGNESIETSMGISTPDSPSLGGDTVASNTDTSTPSSSTTSQTLSAITNPYVKQRATASRQYSSLTGMPVKYSR